MSRKEAKRLLENRKVKEARARKNHAKAQAEYEKAAAKHLPTAAKLRRRVKFYRRWVEKRAGWTKEARRAFEQAPARLKVERTQISPNRSSRGGVLPRRIVLHITVSHNRPGLSDLYGMLDYLCRRDVEASSHVVNDAEGHDGRLVPDSDKAWTQAAYNPDSLSIEQIEWADKPRAAWLKQNAKQLENTATWCAYWSHKYGIPLVQSTSHGVCQHRDLGVAGGGHSDCGPNYPIDFVLKRAREIKKAKYG